MSIKQPVTWNFERRPAKEIRAVEMVGADGIYVDVMDGRFGDAEAQEAA